MSLLFWGTSRCADDDARPVPPSEADPSASNGPPAKDGVPPFPDERFTWIVDAPGHWCHVSSNSGEHRLPEIMCGGVALLDFDGDADLDVFLVQAGTWPDLPDQAASPYPGHALLRNDGDWRFTDVARDAGVFGKDGSYCHGVVAGDYDSDGDPDLYVTALQGNVMYRNEGGYFVDATEETGTAGPPAFSVSATFFDADLDGNLDLYVANYIAYTHELNRQQTCGLDSTGVRDYCSPRVFDGVQDFYFHNLGDGRFEEIAVDAGLGVRGPISNHAKGLGVIASDVDADGDPDLYVANDATANLLFINNGDGQFEEKALNRNVAFNEDGIPQAGMGVDAGDFDRDGLLDLWVVHLDSEENALYRNLGPQRGFEDVNRSARLSGPANLHVGFGTDLFDFDHDTDLDIAIAHGHVLMHARESRQTITYEQRDHLFENTAGKSFELLDPRQAGRWFENMEVSRGLATGDLDGDGDLDMVIACRDAAPAFLRNNHERLGGRPDDAIILEVFDGARPAIGARVEVHCGEHVQVEELRAGGSYASSHAPSLHFGLAEAGEVDRVLVRWIGGQTQELGPLAGGARYRIERGRESAESRPFARPPR